MLLNSVCEEAPAVVMARCQERGTDQTDVLNLTPEGLYGRMSLNEGPLPLDPRRHQTRTSKPRRSITDSRRRAAPLGFFSPFSHFCTVEMLALR